MRRLAIAVALLLVPSAARASGSEIAEQSASASGTGGAGTARAGDPTAAYSNPAALADGRGLRVGQGVVFALPQLHASRAAASPGQDFAVDAAKALQPIPYVDASYSDANVTFGLSVHVPFGASIEWPAGSQLRFDAVQSRLQVFRASPFVGFRFGKFAVAAGPQLDIAEVEAQRAVNLIDTNGHAHLLLHGFGIGAQAAIYAQPTDSFAIGLSYKSRALVPLSGDATFDLPATFAQQYPDQSVTARLKLPDRIALGAMLTLPRGRILTDLVYTTWSFNNELAFIFSQPQTPPTIQKNGWRDTLAIRVGAEYDLSDVTMLRAGAFVDGANNPAAPTETLAPSAPDMTRVGGSVGAGFQITRGAAVDLFYSFFTMLERTSTSNDAILATYTGSAHFVGVGTRFAWDPTSK